jgi:HK97 family phage prohead protease
MNAAETRPPRDGLVRATDATFEVRAASEGQKMPTLFGYLLRFEEWTRIDSLLEGTFMERIAPGAARKTLTESATSIRVLFNHGKDPTVGERALTKATFKEDTSGVYYEGELFDTSYNRDLVPALESGVYGSSMRFRVVKEEFVQEPERSAYNPDGIPERTVTELELREAGPVTFPAYEGATAGLRSLTDFYVTTALKSDPDRFSALLETVSSEGKVTNPNLDDGERDGADRDQKDALSTRAGDDTHSEQSRATEKAPIYGAKAQPGQKPGWYLE